MPNLLDTGEIAAENLRMREACAWQTASMAYCTTAIDLFACAARVTSASQSEDDTLELSHIQALGVRCRNTVGACSDLMVRGYYQQAAVLVRDLLETSFLLDLFSRAPEHLRPWIELGKEAGKKNYKAVNVRVLLEALDGQKVEARQRLYDIYSTNGTHPNSDGIGLISPKGITMVGPFSDRERLIVITYDLTRFAVMAAQHLCQWIVKAELQEDDAFHNLSAACEGITAAFISLNDHMSGAPAK